MITYGNQQCADPLAARETCLRHGLPVDWFGRPNSWACATGCRSGVGWILLPRSSLVALGVIAADGSAASGQSVPRDLVMGVDAGELSGAAKGTFSVTHRGLHVVRAENITPGLRGDDAACYLVELADRRRIARLALVNTSYNVRKPPPDVADYYSATLNSATPWTWTQMAQDVWEAVGTGTLGAYPGLPYAPDGTPENFSFVGHALDALGWVLERIGCALRLDTQADAFSIVRLAADDAAASDALSARDEFRIDDSESINANYGRVPQTLRVYFPRQEAAAPTTTGSSPWHSVDATDPGGTLAGVASGTYAACFDDLPAVYDSGGSLTNSSDLTARANARAADFFARLRREQISRAYALPLSDAGLRPGGTVRVTRWADAGGGLTTEVAWLPREAELRQGGGVTPRSRYGNEAHSDPPGGGDLSWWMGGGGDHAAYAHSHTYLLPFLYHYLPLSGSSPPSDSYPKIIAANAQTSTGTASPVFTISGSGLPKTIGDVVVAMVVGASGTGVASGPSGWTGLQSGPVFSAAFNQYYWCGYRVLDGSEPTNFTFGLAGSGDAWLIAFEITGAGTPNTSIKATGSSASAKFATTAAGAGAAITDDSVLIAMLFADGGTLATESPAPSSYPDAVYHGTVTHMIRPWARHRAVAAVGYFDDCYLTLGSSSRWATVVAVIPPA